MNPNSLLRIRDLSKDELMGILMDAQLFGASQKDWQLPQRRLVANLFFEPSTRTHYSFASAEHQLGCCVEDFTAAGSSVEKGESLYDTVKTFESVGYDAVVIRHRQDEYFRELEYEGRWACAAHTAADRRRTDLHDAAGQRRGFC